MARQERTARPGSSGRLLAVGALVVGLFGGAALGRASASVFTGGTSHILHVEPAGAFDSAGVWDDKDLELPDGSRDRPFGSIPDALKAAEPGDIISVGEGTYVGEIETVRSGLPGRPITLRGGDGVQLRGDRESSVLFEVNHSHIVIEGFQIGQAKRLITIRGANHVVVRDNRISGSEAECVRLRDSATDNRIENNEIVGCGRVGFDLTGKGRNGEGIYVGTAPESLERDDSQLPDRSDNNVIRGNRISSPAECVDVKEFSSNTLIEDNDCFGTKDPNSAGFSIRGDRTTLRNNLSQGNVGAGIRLGGDEDDQGVDALIQGNRLHDNGGHALKVVREPHRSICGNLAEGNGLGIVNRDEYDPTQSC